MSGEKPLIGPARLNTFSPVCDDARAGDVARAAACGICTDVLCVATKRAAGARQAGIVYRES